MYSVIAPLSKQEFELYYQFRWQYLRAPWQQPQGSEQDQLEPQSVHRMIMTEQGQVIAVGRLHKTDQHRAQIRYMAVADEARGEGLGRLIIEALEEQAIKEGVTEIALQAREVAKSFYTNLGYQEQHKTHLLYDDIQHYLMTKSLGQLVEHQQHLASELTTTWHQTIPMSKAMNLQVSFYDGDSITTTCDLDFNKNLHDTMFAGSIYTLATLTGWGWVYFMLNKAGLAGDIVLAEANIKYVKPVAGAGSGHVAAIDSDVDISALSKGRRARVSLQVKIKCGDTIAAVFDGKYAILPLKTG